MPCYVFLVVLLCGSVSAHTHEHEPLQSTTVHLVSFKAGDSSQLMIEAAMLLAQHDFDCSLILVGPAAKTTGIPPANTKLKVYLVPGRNSTCDTDDETLLSRCEVATHLQACEDLLQDKPLMNKLRRSPPRLLLVPGYLHDACVLPLLAGVNTATMVWSVGPASAAWLGHATNSVPFSAQRAPLQPPAFSILKRLSSARQWSHFVTEVESKYWRPAASLVAAYLEIPEPSVDEAYKKVSNLMAASHSLIERPYPALPMRVTIGCFQCRHARPLPEELQEWVLPRRGGLVVATVPYTTQHDKLLGALARQLHQFAVLWITQDPSSSIERPANLVLHPTCTQQDAVGHSRTRLLVSECSETAVLEAVYHGVPMLCLPRTFDQQEPATRVQQLGIGVVMRTPNDNATFVSTVQHVLGNSSLRHASRHLGVMVRDEPETTADRLLFWVGHAARHWGHGHEEAQRTARLTPRDVTGLLDAGVLIGLLLGLVLAPLAILAFKIALVKLRSRELSSVQQSTKQD